MPKKKGPTSFRFSEEGVSLLAKLAEHHGINQTALIEMLLRKEARAELPAETLKKKPRT